MIGIRTFDHIIMSYSNRRSPRTYTYRIPLDDKQALRKMRIFESLHDEYLISRLHKNKINTSRLSRHWGCVFYESREQFSYDQDEMVGGAIPGLGEYRYSLDWKPAPVRGEIEMKRGSDGGTKLKGSRFVGLSDPRLPDSVPIETTVPWTPNEIETMFENDPVPDRMNYPRDPPMVPASDALADLEEELQWAEREGIETVRNALADYVENCDHEHTVVRDDRMKSERHRESVAYCEDCGRDFNDHELDELRDENGLTVVGSV